MENKNLLPIGTKVRGFRFTSKNYNGVTFAPEMEKYIGKIGTISDYSAEYSTYRLYFGDDSWSYPAELINDYVVKEEDDFTKLKLLCEKEGFELTTESRDENRKFYVIKKKDIWEGVEYVELLTDVLDPVTLTKTAYAKGAIFKIKEEVEIGFTLTNGLCVRKLDVKPSTEKAYVDQLKDIAFRKYGEIRDGDRFNMTTINPSWNPNVDITLDFDGVADNGLFTYNKVYDRITLLGFILYQDGKWAERVDIKSKVIYAGTRLSRQDKSVVIDFSFRILNLDLDLVNLHNVGEHLQSKLEEYLNKK